MTFYSGAIGLAEFIVRPADKGFHGFNVYLANTGQFAELQNPIALQLFRCGLVFHVRNCQAVGEPFAAQLCKQCGFANALRAIQNKDGVKLHPRFVHTSNGGAQGFASDSAGIRCVVCTQIIDEQ